MNIPDDLAGENLPTEDLASVLETLEAAQRCGASLTLANLARELGLPEYSPQFRERINNARLYGVLTTTE